MAERFSTARLNTERLKIERLKIERLRSEVPLKASSNRSSLRNKLLAYGKTALITGASSGIGASLLGRSPVRGLPR